MFLRKQTGTLIFVFLRNNSIGRVATRQNLLFADKPMVLILQLFELDLALLDLVDSRVEV